MNAGGTPSSKISAYYGGRIPWVSIADISESGKELSTVEQNLSALGIENSSAKLYPENTLLFAMYASIGKCCIARQRVSSSQAILGLYNFRNVDLDFLYYALSARQKEFIAQGQTGTQSNLSKAIVSNFEIALPDLDIQYKISQVLSTIDTQIKSLQNLILKYESIKKSTLKLLLTPKPGWKTVRLGEVGKWYKGCSLSKNDLSPAGMNKAIHYGELFTSYGVVINKCISHTDISTINGKRGDILFPASDVTPDGLGRCSSLMVDNVVLGGDIIILRPNIDINSEYLSLVINSRRSDIIQRVTGTTVKHSSASKLKEIEITCPDNIMQKKIVDIFVVIDSNIIDLQKELVKNETIKKGMMTYFFG